MKKIPINPQENLSNQLSVIPIILIVFLIILSSNSFAQIQATVPALKDVYTKDFYIGCILSYKHVGFPSDPSVPGQSAVIDPNGGYLVKFHMNSMSPGNNMKTQYTVDLTTSASQYNAASAGTARDSVQIHPVVRFNGDLIAQLNWAKRQGFTFRGHNLVWHSSAPTEFFRSGYTTTGTRLTKDVMIQRMDNYIHEVIRLIHQSWPGLLSAMDVVNEAIDDNTGTVRTTGNEWYTTFGDSTYVMKAFELTRKYTAQYGETQLKLYYNDYNTNIAIKVDGIVRLLTPIFQAGLLDGIGMQEHDANNSPSAADWITSYNKFYPVCSEMSVTELDVTTGSGSPSASVLATQADQYGMLFKCFVERSYKSGRGKIINVSKDGLNDANTFKTNQSSSLWDAQDQCKPSFFAAANVGINYNALDSLILYSDSLKQIEYTTTSWTNFAAALVAANTAKDQNYSATVSADTALGLAKNNLKTAINGLVKIDTLPVELTAFTGFYNGSEVLLNWTTKTEINNRGFEIQTEINGTWVVIGFINGKGTSTAPSQYSFRDATENGTSTVYRLKMVDFNGSYKYSESITVIIIVKFSLSQNYPNPFNPSTQIKYSVPLSGFVSLKVYNLLGEEVATLFEGVRNIGNYTATFDGTKLASGVYVYQLHANNFTDTKKLLLLK